LDNAIKTPYTYTLDFSFGRELPKNFSIEVSYVGHLSHRLLVQEDLAQPTNLVDPKSGIDYFTAVTALAKQYRSGVHDENLNLASLGPAAAYWTNMISPLQPGGAYSIGACTDPSDPNKPSSTTSPVLAAFDLFCGGSANETTPLATFDLGGIADATNDLNCGATGHPACVFYGPSTGLNSYFNAQFSSLYAWRSNGNANYHAMQVNLRHRMSYGVQFDFNYTFSKSIDLMSDAERIGAWGGLGGQIINAWQPNALRGVSDFDTRHQFNSNWIAELPFGRGKLIGRNVNHFADAVIGGWQLSGVFRWTSGFPVNISNGFQWPTNWQLGGQAFRIGPVTTGTTHTVDAQGKPVVRMFPNQAAALAAWRANFPGESGVRNAIRGDGFFGIDLGLAKTWKLPWSEQQRLKLLWEVFNVTNSVRFNVQSNQPEIDISSTFGNYTGLLTKPRVMEFALRYEF
jgi:hypothetical protein